MLNIGIRAHDMEPERIEKLVGNIAKKGFTCTQLALSKAVRDFKVDIPQMTPGFAMYLKKIFEKNSVDVSVLGCYQELGCKDEKRFEEILKIYEAHIRFASVLGVGMVGTETWSGDSFSDDSEAEEILVRNMKKVVSYAEKMGVIIGMEPVSGHICKDFKTARRILDKVGSPNLQIIFDPVNVINKDNYQSQNEIINEAFELCKNEIACIHAKDFIIESNKEKKDVISGDGLLDYKLLMQNVMKYKPYVHILLEETNPDNVMYAKDFIEDTAYGKTH